MRLTDGIISHKSRELSGNVWRKLIIIPPTIISDKEIFNFAFMAMPNRYSYLYRHITLLLHSFFIANSQVSFTGNEEATTALLKGPY